MIPTRTSFILFVIALFMIQSDSDMNETDITFFLSGDVMTGRGIDQILANPVRPLLYESYVKDARHYVELAERVNGPIQKPVPFEYVWGFALEELDIRKPDIRLINLETSITTSENPWEDKGVHYRMHPANIPVLRVGGIDVVSLANNHTLDWGREGLAETLRSLKSEGIPFVGAGSDLQGAARPIMKEVRGTRLWIFGVGMTDSGIPAGWRATERTSGLFLLEDYSENSLEKLQGKIRQYAKPGDIVVVSIHWGGNWGYDIPQRQRDFAHRLIDFGGVDLVHGHSSHHVKGFEVYKNKLILYGCGDLITDYEGISGHESYRSDLGLLYFVTLTRDGDLKNLEMVPTTMKRLQLVPPSRNQTEWLLEVLEKESILRENSIEKTPSGTFRLKIL